MSLKGSMFYEAYYDRFSRCRKRYSGKKISKYFAVAHISTGDLFREQIELDTEIGKKVADIMRSGQLVPDEIVTEVLSQRIKSDDCKKGYILDGYPRDLCQAKMLEDIIGSVDRVILIDVDDDIIIERMAGRRGCPKCGQMYHIKYNPPKTDGICDECGSKLIQRKDDAADTVKNRLKIYHKDTSPIINYYNEKGLLLRVSGTDSIDDIFSYLIKSLQEKAH